MDEAFKTNLALNSKVTAKARGGSEQFAASNLIDSDKETYWSTDDEITKESVEFSFDQSKMVKYVVLQEYIRLGQRIRKFTIEVWKDHSWETVAQATTIGHKRIIRLSRPVETQKLRINFLESRACPVLSNIEIY
jgi:alpha-L-fucosidase